jgi:hypothetical protein
MTCAQAKKKAGTFSILIFLGVKKVVDVNHLRWSMLIFLMLLPHPQETTVKYLRVIFM